MIAIDFVSRIHKPQVGVLADQSEVVAAVAVVGILLLIAAAAPDFFDHSQHEHQCGNYSGTDPDPTVQFLPCCSPKEHVD